MNETVLTRLMGKLISANCHSIKWVSTIILCAEGSGDKTDVDFHDDMTIAAKVTVTKDEDSAVNCRNRDKFDRW